jgi:diguanylate cyclase (GGDEF)-like protein
VASAGDPLVTAAARRLETCLRIAEPTASLRHNDLVARWAGDQFAILLDGLKDVGHAKVVADRILAETLNPFALSGREVRLSASIGVAVSVTGYLRADDALRDAETALYRAQVLGGSHCELFDTAILKSEQAELQLEGDFDAALQHREFELFYQPIVSLASNQVIGFEALVRWQHPVLGMVGPLDFIPIAERTGFIVPLGNWILHEACLQLRTWQTDLPRTKHLWISVNLSGVQLRDPALVEQIGEALRDSGLEPHSLTLELTEGIAMDNPTAVTTLLMRLRATGVRISIDDFGTGYSSNLRPSIPLGYARRSVILRGMRPTRTRQRSWPHDGHGAELAPRVGRH